MVALYSDFHRCVRLCRLGQQQNEVLLLNVAKMVDFARRGADGILNALCFNCMLGTVSAAIAGRLRNDHQGIPIANLVYSSVEDSQSWKPSCIK